MQRFSKFGVLLLVIVQFSHQKRHICKVGNADPKQNNYPNCKLGIEHCGQKDCNSDQEYCTAVFKEENGHLAPVLAGCWEKPDSTVQVDTNECVLRHQPRKDYIMYECWCNGELCNNNITFPKYIVNPAAITTTNTTSLASKPSNKSQRIYFIYYTIIAPFFVFVILSGLCLYFWVKRKRRRRYNENLMVDFNATMTQPSAPSALLLEVVHQSEMSVIWKGTYAQRLSAIKVVNKMNVTQWVNERDIFLKYKLKHENIVNFISAERRNQDTMPQYWLVTEYHQNGSLASYLLNNILSKDIFLKMLYSTIRGLVYLHTNLQASSGKPMIAHRDLKPANILVKKDLSCCISDLGLALVLEEDVIASGDLCQAGTKRFMSPEILQGSITFQQESFLKADMYSIGLVMWEMFSRTKINIETEVGVYETAYHKLVNFNPTVDEMLKCIVDNRERPIIPPEWKQTQALETIANTIEECWDEEPDARLTSHCVLQRVKKLIFSPRDDTFDALLLEQLKEFEREDSQCSSNCAPASFIANNWDSRSPRYRNDTYSSSSVKSLSQMNDDEASLASTSQMNDVDLHLLGE